MYGEIYVVTCNYQPPREASNEVLALDGGADCFHLGGGNGVALCAERLDTVEHVLIATAENLNEVVAIGPGKLFHSVNQEEHAFHRVAEARVILLPANQSKLDAAACEVVQVEAYAMTTGGAAQIKIAGVFLGVVHLAAITSVCAVAIKQGTAEIVMMIDDIEQLANCFHLGGLSAAKKGVRQVHMHAAIRAARDIKSGKIGVVHQLKGGILIADKLAGHYLGNAFGGNIAGQATIALKLEKVGGEMGEDNVIKNFGVDGRGMNAAALGLNLQTKAAQGLTIGAVKSIIKANEAVRGKILVRAEALESVFLASPYAAVILGNVEV